jgi:uncharacterized membrane-anchored protein
MQEQHLPQINLRYWIGITLASVFGTNLGDLYAHETNLGIAPGLTLLALLCAAVFVVEHFDRGTREVYYWLVIVIIRTAATNIADYTAYELNVPEIVLNAGLIALLFVLAWLQRRMTAGNSGFADRLPATGRIYWVAMLTAGVLGTVLGDVCEQTFGEGVAALGLASLLVGVLFWRRAAIGSTYWLIVAVARTAGTGIGDWFAENRTLNVGLPCSTLVTGLLFVGVLLLWRQRSIRATLNADP